ncbi:hypothetical protein [Mucilaginibacter sp.]|uniref:hypothetical protein n=1 Tax=Mucilaginibacter sp. TaxID=1882438 RepID=UPI0035BBAD16
MNRKNAWSAILLSIFLYACKSVENKMLPGTYAFRGENWPDTIKIFNNNTYEHFSYQDGKRLVNKGKWTFNTRQVTFKNFTFFNGGDGLWISTVELSAENKVKLIYASDSDMYFEQIN